MGKIGGDEAGGILLKARRDTSRNLEVKCALTMALGLCKATNAVPDLLESLRVIVISAMLS